MSKETPLYIATPEGHEYTAPEDYELASIKAEYGEDMEPCLVEPIRFYIATVFEVGLAYGGPEEGGWWYRAGEETSNTELATLMRRFLRRDEAVDYLHSTIYRAVAQANEREGRLSMTGVNDDYKYEARICINETRSFPIFKPYYC